MKSDRNQNRASCKVIRLQKSQEELLIGTKMWYSPLKDARERVATYALVIYWDRQQATSYTANTYSHTYQCPKFYLSKLFTASLIDPSALYCKGILSRYHAACYCMPIVRNFAIQKNRKTRPNVHTTDDGSLILPVGGANVRYGGATWLKKKLLAFCLECASESKSVVAWLFKSSAWKNISWSWNTRISN